jgi:sulfite reductase (ferredoxin)
MAQVEQEGVKLSPNEGLKESSEGLRGTIGEELASDAVAFTDDATNLLKHHGTYQQDDRDKRKERRKQGLDKDYKMMVRTKFPGGILSAEQYILCDDLADQYGQHDLRVTSRQGFQFHGVVKGSLRPLIHDLNLLGKMTTLGACGDVVRNTMAAPVADIDAAYARFTDDLLRVAQQISDATLPKSTAYFDLWLDDEKVTVHPDGRVEFASKPKSQPEDPLYGTHYLPRKFKIGIATDFDNSVDIYTQDIGIVAITDDGAVTGYDILVGGGLGYTHRKPETYARAGTPLVHVQEAGILPVVEAIIKVQRDFGDRANRKHARLKYMVEEWGIEKFRAKVFEYAGREYDLPTGRVPSAQPDYLGWHKQHQDGLNYVGVWVENGRIKDFEGSFRFRTGLRKVVEQFQPSIRLTPHHNVILANIRDEDVDAVQALLDDHGIPTDKGISTIRRMEMACPALPLCGLAMAEAERAMPGFIEGLEAAGHGGADVMIRMSGCPNNCSRPRSAEIGIVGFGADQYQVYAGGCFLGSRLNESVHDKVKGGKLVPVVAAMLDIWKAERQNGERFGDFSHRIGPDALRDRTESLLA